MNVVAILTLISSVVVFLVVGGLMKKWSASLHPRIIDLELAWSAENARVLLRTWSLDDRNRAKKVLLLDCVWLLAYAAGGVVLALLAGNLARNVGWWLGDIVGWVVIAFVVGAGFDLLENISALLMIARGSTTGGFLPRVTTLFSIAKFALLGLASLYFLAWFIRAEFSAIWSLITWIWPRIWRLSVLLVE